MPSRIRIELFSDTMTKPTAEMRRFMCDAEVGDGARANAARNQTANVRR